MRKIAFLLVFAALFSGCASGGARHQIEHLIGSGDCKAALRVMEESREDYGSNGRLLFLLDSAMVHMQCGRYESAQSFFREAERTADRLWTESISQNAASLLVNDYMRAYPGEDFERAMIHLMSAIGYLQMDEPEEALVEARRLDTLLNVYNTKYVEKNVYKEDAFGRYLSGLLREDDNAPDDAFIDYLLAARAYDEYEKAYGTRRPRFLEEDLSRLGKAVGRTADVEQVLGAVGADPPLASLELKGKGKVVYIQFSGEAPEKVQDTVLVPTGRGPISLAFPKMIVRPPACADGRLSLRSGDVALEMDTELVEDVNQIAVKNLDDRKGRIIGRTLLRAAAKQIAIEGAATQGDDETAETIRLILNMLNLFVERADTRSWKTLPGEIHMARGYLPAGRYDVTLSRCGEDTVLVRSLRVAAGKTQYLFYDTRYGAASLRPKGEKR
ncbi:MAG: hypothetical protein PVG78_19765 [Desulfobacterales bacterium]|jgi:hypothetical protein